MHGDRLRNLCDERDVQRALILFARAMDDRDWDRMAELLTHDAHGDFGMGRVQGSHAIIELIRGFLDACGPTQHLLGNIVIDVEGDTAVSRSYVRDVHLTSTADPSTRFYTIGDYRDTWRRRTDGSWCLTERIKDNRAHVGPLAVFGS
ncbi:nuclear transport factor 2 family protein [Mycobacterium sp. HNNTM2301]|uniref:nuclear transport factor 2 family protein n=1 Tax=Mycobacterium hainanense TaxID=3289775 RepID=UPI0035A57E5B